eukprot:CAMPEP_0185846224 /NCGR_PEP_ID=MMETSP1354-20130828/1941_1 /TAXON_ID=708628 /ORGANISM="Erythrolobus madagascarensis, Strain CCMP3276" /LENGTH=150 /DNA_ID=CAMNT_0028546327 /DNA_START=33 /DNA_END=485 /DNA_ORIENTATION=+
MTNEEDKTKRGATRGDGDGFDGVGEEKRSDSDDELSPPRKVVDVGGVGDGGGDARRSARSKNVGKKKELSNSMEVTPVSGYVVGVGTDAEKENRGKKQKRNGSAGASGLVGVSKRRAKSSWLESPGTGTTVPSGYVLRRSSRSANRNSPA